VIKPSVAVLILNYKQPNLTLQCLKSLSKLSYSNYHIYLLDNESDGNLEKRLSQNCKLKYFKRKDNLGFTKGNNFLIKKALKDKAEYLLLLNNDTEIKPGLIEAMLGEYKDETAGLVGSVITYFNKSNIVWFAGGSLHPLFFYTRHPGMNKVFSSTRKLGKIDWITGCCLMIKRSVIEKIGLLDDDYGSYWEDVDWCYRVKQAGYGLRVVNKPLVLHKVSSSFGKQGTNTLTSQRAYFYGCNPMLFIRKHVKGWRKYVGVLGQLLLQLPYYMFVMALSRQFSAIIEYLRGIVDGLVKGISNHNNNF
jgi:GT2 family glycosyltransferase